ncbi:MAG: DsbE family thiol:disulfide interchange protein [Spongiibacteraceae bacterium]|jgi:cytochrome c biogenesis protein CcmG/thiol:disulfide interchange protein DsbE|nr:DsbE family thiol:disulfide interchange protein [Spongiibacteraceae bacterium]
MARQRLILFLPLLVFIGVVVLFFVMQREMGRGEYDPQALPSALLNKPLPAFELTDLHEGRPVTSDDLKGRVALVNVWATWCPSCYYEHPYLNQLEERGVVIYGVNYKDVPEKAKQWLAEKGDPYALVLDDRQGRLGLDLGVTGAPETYVIDHRGTVRMRYQGPLDERVWQESFAALIEQLQAEAQGAGA